MQPQYDQWQILHVIGRNYNTSAVNAFGARIGIPYIHTYIYTYPAYIHTTCMHTYSLCIHTEIVFMHTYILKLHILFICC